jgi:hypothetical protein
MITNFRRLLIAHFALGLASGLAYWARPGAFTPLFHMPPRAYALLIILQTFIPITPYVISGAYSCGLLSAREPKATVVFIFSAVGVGIIADCLYLNLFGMKLSPLLLSAGVTTVLIVAARLYATIWRSEVFN